jgi:hypothetical protein
MEKTPPILIKTILIIVTHIIAIVTMGIIKTSGDNALGLQRQRMDFILMVSGISRRVAGIQPNLSSSRKLISPLMYTDPD